MNVPAVENRFQLKRLHFGAILLAALAVGLLVGFWFQGKQVSTADIKATVLEPAKNVTDFTLVTHWDTSFTVESLQGKWSFLFFGYTHCPDVCPTTLHTLTQVTKHITEGKDGDQNIQVVFVSVDPQRDTIERLARYVPYFDQSFIGVTGKQADINEFTHQLGILHIRVAGDNNEGYLVDHSASILLFNPNGQLRALFGAPHKAEEIVEDFAKITQL